jgi:hypothetical protein
MICEECKKEGKKSTIHISNTACTAMYFPEYYDENGIRHHHDNNLLSTDYRCSYGHVWIRDRMPPKCPGCNWPEEEKA